MKRRNTKPVLLPLWATEARAGPKLEARAHLLEAAATAFMRGGYAGTTLDDVARIDAVTKGQICRYHRSKIDLYFNVVVGAFFMINERVRPVALQTDQPVDQRLHRMACEHATVVMTKFSFQKAALDAARHRLHADASLRQHRAMARILRFRREYHGLVQQTIAEGVEAAAFEVTSVLLATRAMLGALNWLTVWYAPERSPTPAYHETIAVQTASRAAGDCRGGRDERSPARSRQYQKHAE
jgi:AcrR family transcriptional regulator